MDLHHNKLSEVHDGIGGSSQLRVLHLNTNYLNVYPDEILKLFNLIDLDISSNDIRDYPLKLTELDKLNLVFIQENPIAESDNPVELKKMITYFEKVRGKDKLLIFWSA